MTTEQILELQDRRFRALGEGSLEHDWWFQSRLEKAGLGQLTLKKGEAAIDFARRIVFETLEAGVIYELLGALMVPEGTDDDAWTPALALETAAFLRKLRDPVAKARVQEVYLQLLIPFVRDGIARLFVMCASLSTGESPIARPPSKGRPWIRALVRGLKSWVPWRTGTRHAWPSSTPAGRSPEPSAHSRPGPAT